MVGWEDEVLLRGWVGWFEVVEEEGRIVVRRHTSIFDLAGSGAGKGDVEELKGLLDEMREEDAREERL